MNIDNQERSSSEDVVFPAPCREGVFQWLFGSPLRFVVGVITLFSASVGIWQWFDNRRSEPSVSANLWGCQCEVQQKNIEGFKCYYTYHDHAVNDLWTARVTLVNTCSRNIIGVVGGDLMSTNICFEITKNFKIVAIEQEVNEFDAVTCFTSNRFAIAFKKWRPSNRCTIKLFCERTLAAGANNQLSFGVVGDPLKQGTVQVNIPDGRILERVVDKSLLTLFPTYISKPLRWCGIIVYGLIFVICIIILIFVVPWVGLLRRKIWEHRYGVRFNFARMELKDFVWGRGYDGIPNEFWMKHHIPKPITRLRYVDNPASPSVWVLVWMAVFTGIALSALITI